RVVRGVGHGVDVVGGQDEAVVGVHDVRGDAGFGGGVGVTDDVAGGFPAHAAADGIHHSEFGADFEDVAFGEAGEVPLGFEFELVDVDIAAQRTAGNFGGQLGALALGRER